MADKNQNPPPFGWSTIPPLHKRRFFQGVAAFAIVAGFAAAWVFLRADATLNDWNSRIPHAEATINAPNAMPAPPADDKTATDAAGLPAVKTADITIILSGGGISDTMTNQALQDLPSQMPIAFSPYAANVQDWIKKADASQRESLLLIPMESANYPRVDTGPKTLLTRLSVKENQDNLAWILGRATGYVAVMNDMGGKYLADTKDLMPVFADMQKRNLLFVENPAPGGAKGAPAAAASILNYIPADVHIDADASSGFDIQQQLLALEKKAHERGYAIGVAQPYPATLSALKEWSQNLDRRGIKLVSLSTIVKEAAAHDQTQPADDKQPAPQP